MAIVVEENRRSQGGFVAFFIWLMILVAVAAGIYFIFFKNPELVEFTGSSSFKNVQQLSKITIDPNQLLSNPKFQQLKPYITVNQPQHMGRSNPFIAY